MHSLSARSPLQSRPYPLLLALAALCVLVLGGGAALYAQVSGERGIPPVASSTDIEVRGIEVNTTGDSAEEARIEGWREAQRLAWEELDGPEIPDSRLEDLVSAIVVEQENLGPRRYIATLSVIFDRQRAGELLGGGGEQSRSAPMLTLPVLISGGTQTMFEQRNPWQRAWAEYQFGQSTIDYVRPSGMGGESLLLTAGQTQRRSRAWWNTILDQFSAADVLIPIANLDWQWPGGPVEGRFTARYGPDNRFLDEFTMRAESAAELPAMLTRAVAQFDQIYARALAAGTLRPDPTLTLEEIEIPEQIRALIEESRRAEEAEQAAARDAAAATQARETAPEPAPEVAATTIGIQASTPNAAAFDDVVSSLRAIPGVRSVSVSSTAIGGASVLLVTYAGETPALAAALRSRGWQVSEGNDALGIAR